MCVCVCARAWASMSCVSTQHSHCSLYERLLAITVFIEPLLAQYMPLKPAKTKPEGILKAIHGCVRCRYEQHTALNARLMLQLCLRADFYSVCRLQRLPYWSTLTLFGNFPPAIRPDFISLRLGFLQQVTPGNFSDFHHPSITLRPQYVRHQQHSKIHK